MEFTLSDITLTEEQRLTLREWSPLTWIDTSDPEVQKRLGFEIKKGRQCQCCGDGATHVTVGARVDGQPAVLRMTKQAYENIVKQVEEKCQNSDS